MHALRSFFIIALLLCAVGLVRAQSPATIEWIRVQSDNGELSIEFPANYKYVFDENGFQVGGSSSAHLLRDMSILSSYEGGTLLSVESYKADSGAIEVLARSAGKRFETRKTLFRNIKVAESVLTDTKFHSVIRYLHSKTHVYVLTAITRGGGSSAAMTRFFDSLEFPRGSAASTTPAVKMSQLKASKIAIKTKDVAPVTGPPPAPGPTPADEDPPVIVVKPIASYVGEARVKNTSGEVQLRLHLSKDGSIPEIEVLKSLPDGLLRQAIFSALRIKFLPKQKAGVPVDSTRTLAYTFNIY